MQRLQVFLAAMVVVTGGTTAVHAQGLYVPRALFATGSVYAPPALFSTGSMYAPPAMFAPGTLNNCGSNVGRNDNTRVPSPREIEIERRRMIWQDATRRLDDKKKELADHIARMERDNNSRGQRPYEKGWIHYGTGNQPDATYNRLQTEVDELTREEAATRGRYNEMR